MEYIILFIVAFGASILTFFSGFGLGTILLPVFLSFFSVGEAVAATAIVHLINNLFKLNLLKTHLQKTILLQFGIPAIIGAFIGAQLLQYTTANLNEIVLYTLVKPVSILNFSFGCLLLLFALVELVPTLKNISIPAKYMKLGGFISGFMGGYSGFQGALRTAFLIRLNLSKNAFIATGVAIACFIDVSRIAVYIPNYFESLQNQQLLYFLLTGIIAAILGALIGKQILKKTTIQFVQVLIGAFLLLYSAGILLGLTH